MSNFEMKEGIGYLFINKRKEKDNHPDFKAEMLFQGEMVDVAAWEKTTRKGDRMFTLKMSKKDPKFDKPKQPQQSQDFDEDCPF